MSGPLVSSSRRAATWLCASCRREALGRSSFSTTTAATTARQRLRATVTKPLSQTPRRWLSQTPTLLSDSTPPSSSSPPTQNTTNKIPTYYALFPETLSRGPPPSGPFAIDIRALRREFLRLQASAHPDFHHSASGASASPRREAEATSALINSAFKTLSHPLHRAEYLLHELYGVDLAGDERGAETSADPEVLMTVLEAREEIEEAEREEDLQELRAVNEERIEETEKGLERAFKAGDVEEAKEEAVRLRYWMNIRESVDGWEKGKGVVLHH